jgi:hypothetical protein
MSEALTPVRSPLDGTSGDSPGRPTPHLKTGNAQAFVGSNPTPSAPPRPVEIGPNADFDGVKRVPHLTSDSPQCWVAIRLSLSSHTREDNVRTPEPRSSCRVQAPFQAEKTGMTASRHFSLSISFPRPRPPSGRCVLWRPQAAVSACVARGWLGGSRKACTHGPANPSLSRRAWAVRGTAR